MNTDPSQLHVRLSETFRLRRSPLCRAHKTISLSPGFFRKWLAGTRSEGEISSLIEFPPSVTERDITRLGHSYPRTRVCWFLDVMVSRQDERCHRSRSGEFLFRFSGATVPVSSSNLLSAPSRLDRRCTTGLSRTSVTGRAAFQPHHPPASFATITRVVRCRFAQPSSPTIRFSAPHVDSRRHPSPWMLSSSVWTPLFSLRTPFSPVVASVRARTRGY